MGPLSFGNPSALLLFLPLAAILVALYLLRMRRRELRVPATFLWPARTDEVRANALFQKLRPSWLLFLQMLALALAVFCLGRPQTRQRGLAGEVTVFVLDSSASMGATDVLPSRFAEGKKLAREAILSTKPGDRTALIEAGPVPRVVFPLGNDPARQVSALDALEGTDAEADVGEAMRLATAVVSGLEGARIVLISDGDFEPIKDFSQGKAAVVYRSVGKGGENVAVEALGVTDTARGRQVYAGLKNYGSEKRSVTLSLYADGKAIDSVKLEVPAHGTQGRTISAPTGVRLFEAKLITNDALKADDYAATSADPAASLRVLKVGGEDPFVDRALALDPRVTLDRAASLPADGGATYDIVVFDGVVSQPTKSRGMLILGDAGPGAPVTVTGSAKAPRITGSETVPLTKGVDLDGVFIDNMQQVQPRPGGEVLIRSSAGPLLVAEKSAAQRTIYLAFAPLQSDFPLQVGFPIFIANALDYLGGETGGGPLVVQAGRPFSVPVTSSDPSLKLPDGSRDPLKAIGGAATVREARKIGEYELDAGGKPWKILATLQSPRESDIAPITQIALADHPVKAMAAPLRFADFWRTLAVLCLLVLGVEWWLYARRS